MMDLVAQDIVYSLFCKFPFPEYPNLIVLVQCHIIIHSCAVALPLLYMHMLTSTCKLSMQWIVRQFCTLSPKAWAK